MNDSQPPQSDSHETPEGSENPQPDIYIADDALPEVQAPNSKFLIQLFVVPFLIVMAAILLVMIPKWLSSATRGKPEDYLAELERTNHATWQAAWNLAEAMHDVKNEPLKSDPAFAEKLVSLLRRQLDDKTQISVDESVRLRCFLCRTIGSLHIDTGMPILIETASTERDEKEIEMRIFALEALAELINNLGADTQQENEELFEVIQTASLEKADNPDLAKLRDQLRVRAAFAFGVLGGEKGLDRLASMTDDSLSDVRYNAANGLARHGDERAIPVLLEMLNPKVIDETQNNSKDYQRMHSAIVMSNALRASILLKHENPEADLTELDTAIDVMLKKDLPLSVRNEALRVQEIFAEEEPK